MRIVYRSAARTVVSDGIRVAELTDGGGWVRTIGSGGPMSGELIAIRTSGTWPDGLSESDMNFVRLAEDVLA